MLEECGLEYELHPIHIGRNEQFAPEFLKISPNNKIPAIVDEDGPGGEPISVFESAAILIYLAEKTGRFLPSSAEDPRGRIQVLEWVMWQMGSVGPMLGQNGHFRNFAPEKVPYGIKRYADEMDRIYRVADKRLADNRYLAGDDYTIADILTFPWLRTHEFQNQNMDGLDNVQRWLDEIAARPAVARGLKLLKD